MPLAMARQRHWPCLALPLGVGQADIELFQPVVDRGNGIHTVPPEIVFGLLQMPFGVLQRRDSGLDLRMRRRARGGHHDRLKRERHLSRDPTYVAYAEWMNKHGMIAWLGRLIPALRYRAPAPR